MVADAGSEALSVAVRAWDLLKEVHYLHYLRHSLASGKTTGREHNLAHQQKIDLLSMAPSIRTRPSFPHSQSLPSGSFHKPLILINQREDRMKTTITEN